MDGRHVGAAPFLLQCIDIVVQQHFLRLAGMVQVGMDNMETGRPRSDHDQKRQPPHRRERVGQRSRKAAVGGFGLPKNPAAAVQQEVVPGVDRQRRTEQQRSPDEVEQHRFVIAAHGMEPGFVQQCQAGHRVRPTIDQIADRKQAVHGGVEMGLVHQSIQHGPATVQVADDKILATGVGRQHLNGWSGWRTQRHDRILTWRG